MSETLEYMQKVISVGYTSHSGVEITAIGDGFAEGKINIKAEHLNPYGAVHGGASFCLADVIGGAAFRTLGGLPVTLNSNVTYLRPVNDAKVIYARADVVRHGKTTSFVEIKIFNDKMIECIRVVSTYYNVESRLADITGKADTERQE